MVGRWAGRLAGRYTSRTAALMGRRARRRAAPFTGPIKGSTHSAAAATRRRGWGAAQQAHLWVPGRAGSTHLWGSRAKLGRGERGGNSRHALARAGGSSNTGPGECNGYGGISTAASSGRAILHSQGGVSAQEAAQGHWEGARQETARGARCREGRRAVGALDGHPSGDCAAAAPGASQRRRADAAGRRWRAPGPAVGG
jgi:hypothetical protein